MKILWLQTGTTNCEPIIGSLEALHHPDYELWEHNYFSDNKILEAVQELNPDLVLYLSVVAGPNLPKLETLKEIRNKSKFVHICCDASCKDWWELIELYQKESVFDLTINIDGNENWPRADNHLTMYCPVDSRPYETKIAWNDRVYDFSFAGGNGSLGRRKILEKLSNHIKIKPREEGYGSYQNYADFLKQTKICLNMCDTGPVDTSQLKARVIEAGLAGCCLLEQEGAVVPKYFQKGIHFESFKNETDVIEKLNMLISNPDYQMALAQNLQGQIKIKFSAYNFWKEVFNFCQLPWE